VNDRNHTLLDNVALLGWAVLLAFLLSVILFGAMVGGAYMLDEICSSSLI
jgi:hypothetical protein